MKKIRVVLDTNIIISAILFQGKPKQVLDLVLDQVLIGITSVSLLAELTDVLTKKFPLTSQEISLIEQTIRDDFIVVKPTQMISILHDDADNRVLEAAVRGKCNYVITGDREMLALGNFYTIAIVSPQNFLAEQK